MQPYVIRQGDHLSLLAHQFGFHADTVWNDPANADLRKLRPNPNMLWPTDILYIPDPPKGGPPMTSLTPGSTNDFVTRPPTVAISVTFPDPTFASQAYSIQEAPDLAGLTTDANGTMAFSVPVTLQTATIVFTATGVTFVCSVGGLDPIDTVSGIAQRLQHLGFMDPDAIVDASDLSPIRAALRAFRAAQGILLTPPPSQPSVVDPGDGGPPPSSPSPNASEEDASTGDGNTPPASTPAPSSDASASPDDDAGLADDGTLDDATHKLLLAAHGS